MRGPVLHFERGVGILPVVVMALDLVHLLQESAAESDIHLLEAAADREHRKAGRDGLRDHGQRGRIAQRVVQGPGGALRAAVVMRLDVRGAPGQQQAVEALEQELRLELGTQRRDQHRYRIRRFPYRRDVLLAHHVKPMVAEQATVRRYPNEGLRCTHVNYFKQPARAAGVQNWRIRPHPPGWGTCAW